MRLAIVLRRSFRLGAALLVSAAAVVFAPGCDSASQPASVDLGGKEGRDKMQPGPTGGGAGGGEKGETPLKPDVGAMKGKSIKQRPAG